MMTNRLPRAALSSCSLILACAQQPAEAPHEFGSREVEAGATCGNLTRTEAPLNEQQARVFVELAHIDHGQQPKDGARLSDGNLAASGAKPSDVQPKSSSTRRALQVAHLVAHKGVEASHPWGPCADEDCSVRSHSVSIAPTLPQHQTDPIPVSLRLSQAGGSPTFETKLTLQHEQPQRLDAPELSFGRGHVVATAYVLASSGDLIQLLRCKAEQVGIEEIRR